MLEILHDWEPYTASRTPPDTWERALADVAPYSDRHTWLKLAWNDECERWVIYQMVPPKYVSSVYWAEEQPVRFDAARNKWYPDPNQKLLLNRGMVSATGWRLYKETGHAPSLWWIIQGSNGGHRYKLDKIESKLAQLEWGEKDTPEPGELPYAAFDARVIDAIGPLDKLRAYKSVVEFAERHPDAIDAEKKERAEEARKAILSNLRTQIRTNISEDRAAWRAWFRENARNVTAEDKRKIRVDYEQAEHHLITGAVA